MAGKHGIALDKNVALVAATAKTIVQVFAAINHPINITEVEIGGDATDSTFEAMEVELIRQTDAGTSAALTVVGANDSDGDTFDTTARKTVTIEPAGTIVLRHWRVHPQVGFVYQPPSDAPIHCGAADRIGLRVTSANVLNVDAYLTFEE